MVHELVVDGQCPPRPVRRVAFEAGLDELVANVEHARHRAGDILLEPAALVVGHRYRERPRSIAGRTQQHPRVAAAAERADQLVAERLQRLAQRIDPCVGGVVQAEVWLELRPRPGWPDDPRPAETTAQGCERRQALDLDERSSCAEREAQDHDRRPSVPIDAQPTWRPPGKRVEPGAEIGRALVVEPVDGCQARDRRMQPPPLADERQAATAGGRSLLPVAGSASARSITLDPANSPLPAPVPAHRLAIEQQDRALVLVRRPQNAAEAGGDRAHGVGLVAAERPAGPGRLAPR